ncbi:glycosyltransferase family 4 protein [Chloroflexota bacterium]|nr:glycosyltransferase family 4 protein [Chloroflexota bacterium]
MDTFSGKVGLVQRVLPVYRAPFFNALGQACPNGLSVFTGQPRAEEMIKTTSILVDAALVQGKNWHFFHGNRYLCWQSCLHGWLTHWEPDVLIVEANPRYLSTPGAIRWMKNRQRTVIGWGLGAPPLSGALADLRRNRRLALLRQLDGMITYSQTGAAEYASLGFPEDRIFVAANAVTPPPAHPLPIRPPLKGGQIPRILFVGRLQARKNIANLLRACADRPKGQQPEVVIVGDGPERNKLEALAAEIYPAAVFTGALYGDALEEQFRAADLFVLPGTGGLAIQQAMSFGLPVIAAEADGTQADLVRPTNGWQILAGDVSALSQALNDALADPDRLRRMGAESYRIVAEEINLDKMVNTFIQALNRSVA